MPVPLVYSEAMTKRAASKPELPAAKPHKPNSSDVPKPRKNWVVLHWKLSLAIIWTAILVGSGGVLALNLFKTEAHTATKVVLTPTPGHGPTPSPFAATMDSPLTGLPVAPTLASRPITAVIVENQTAARPQSGLSQAGVVYEANAEGGITRYEAFFLDQRPSVIGPVRSVRTYFVDWALEFDAPLAHAGGNADALDLIGPLGMKDMNALTSSQSAFYRTTDRVAPHNLYTNSNLLDTLETKLGYNKPADFTPSPRKTDAPNQNPPHPNIHINFSYSGYQVDWMYSATTNNYARNLAGAPDIDRNNGQQIYAKNIVIEMMPTSYGYTRIGESTVIMATVGSGQGWVMRDGGVVPITWEKSSHYARTQLIDAAGQNVPLDRGNTWYEIVPVGNDVSF
jgi:hypothetical protein